MAVIINSRSTILLSFTLLISGCFLPSGGNVKDLSMDTPRSKVTSIDFYAARGSIPEPTFEHFTFTREGNSFIECGWVRGGKDVVSTTEVATISPDSFFNLAADFISNTSTTLLPPPSKTLTPFDGGRLTITFIDTNNKEYSYKTTLDEITTPSSSYSAELQKIVYKARGVVKKTSCISEPRYGLKAW